LNWENWLQLCPLPQDFDAITPLRWMLIWKKSKTLMFNIIILFQSKGSKNLCLVGMLLLSAKSRPKLFGLDFILSVLAKLSQQNPTTARPNLVKVNSRKIKLRKAHIGKIYLCEIQSSKINHVNSLLHGKLVQKKFTLYKLQPV